MTDGGMGSKLKQSMQGQMPDLTRWMPCYSATAEVHRPRPLLLQSPRLRHAFRLLVTVCRRRYTVLLCTGVDLAGILRGTHGQRRRWVGAEWGGVW